MYKREEKQLMRQKVNATDTLINRWQEYYMDDIRHIIHASMMRPEDLGKTFEHQERTFEIIGMTLSKTIVLRETRSEGIFYWECTRHFVQMKLGRFNEEFYQVPKKKRLLTREIPYANYQMYLPPLNKRIKVETLEPEIDEVESVEISYEEDHITNETEE
jgi:hypothetical protein